MRKSWTTKNLCQHESSSKNDQNLFLQTCDGKNEEPNRLNNENFKIVGETQNFFFVDFENDLRIDKNFAEFNP